MATAETALVPTLPLPKFPHHQRSLLAVSPSERSPSSRVRVAELLARTILISDLPPSTSSRSSPAATKKESLGDNVRKTERTRQLSDLGSDIRPSNENEEDETERGSGLRDSNSGSESDSVDGNESGDAEETLESVASKEDEEQDAELKRLLGFYGSVVFQAFNRNASEAKQALLLDNTLFRSHQIRISPFRPSEHPKLAVDLTLGMEAPEVLRSEFPDAFENNEDSGDLMSSDELKADDLVGKEKEGDTEAVNLNDEDSGDDEPGKEKCLEPDYVDIPVIEQGKEEEEEEEEGEDDLPVVETLSSQISEQLPIMSDDYDSMRLEFDKCKITYRGEGVLYNFRDITYLTDSSKLRLRGGVIYRGACWSRKASLTAREVKIALKFLEDSCNINTFLDLRSRMEKLEDLNDPAVEQDYPTLKDVQLYHYHPSSSLQPPTGRKLPKRRRYHVDLVTSKLKLQGVLMAPGRTYIKILRSSLSSRPTTRPTRSASSPAIRSSAGDVKEEVADQQEVLNDLAGSPSSPRLAAALSNGSPLLPPDTASRIFINEVFNEKLGLDGLNRLILLYAQREIREIFSILLNTQNHPVMIHCKSGKDRTGLVVALVLSVCGVDRKLIVEDYAHSEVFLQEDGIMEEVIAENRDRGLSDKFDGTPQFVMETILEFIDKQWGSVSKFLNDACKVSYVEQHYLRRLLVMPARK